MAWYNPFSWGNSSGNTVKEGYQNDGPASRETSAAPVTFDSAMGVSAWWACAKLLSETVAAMPIKCYERQEDGSRKQITDNRVWRVLRFQPNRYQTTTEFFETVMLNLVTTGNAYIELKKTTRQISSYLPLMSSQMQVRLKKDGSIQYEYNDLDSTRRDIPQDNIWHIKLFGNGVVGMSPLEYHRQSLGLSIATDNRATKIAKNGGKVSGILTIDKVLTPEHRAAVRKNMQDIASGDTDTLKILEAGMEFQQVALSPQDMQMLESRHFSVEDICRIMGVPSVLVNDTSGSTTWGSGIKEINTAFYKLNLRPHLERIESSIKRWLLPSSEWETIDIEFDFKSLLRPSYEDRMTANSVAINSGQLTPNEARNDEGLDDKEGGDEIYLNGSLVKAGTERQENMPMETVNDEDNTP